MKESKIGPVAGPISIVLGIAGVGTAHLGYMVWEFPIFIGFSVAVIGMLFGYKSSGYVNSKVTILGIFLNNLAIVRFIALCLILGSKNGGVIHLYQL